MTKPARFVIEDTGITLAQALKFMGVAETGGEGKMFVGEGRVRVNGEVELRKRRQMVAGDIVEVNLDGQHTGEREVSGRKKG